MSGGPSYVIRGGEVGKARLHLIGSALERSTVELLENAGIAEGMRGLDLGCGGGDVTLAMARLVGPSGRVAGIDMDPVKVDLARQDAAARGLTNVDVRTGDATSLDADAVYDLARLLLAHVADPSSVLHRMVEAVRPGGLVVVEDIDHTAVFTHPRSPAFDRYIELFNELLRRRGGDPEIETKLLTMFRRAGLEQIQLGVVQPAYIEGDVKRIHQITLENMIEPMVAAGLATVEQLKALAAEMDAFADDPDSIIGFPRIYQLFGYRPSLSP